MTAATSRRDTTSSGAWRHIAAGLAVVALLLAAPAVRGQTGEDRSEHAAAAPSGQSESASAPREFRSPRRTLETFLVAMTADPPDLVRAARCLVLTDVVPEKAPYLANDLYRILNRIELIDVEGDPTIPGFEQVTSEGWAGRDRWVYFPREPYAVGADVFAKRRRFDAVESRLGESRIVLARQDSGGWKFSAETVASIDEMWRSVREMDPVAAFTGSEMRTVADHIESLWPQSFVESGFLGVRTWQWATLAALILIGVVLDFTVRGVLTVVSRRIIVRRGGRATSETLRRTVRPFGLTAAALLWLWAITLLDLPNEALKVLITAAKLFAMLATVWAAFRLTDLLSEVAASKAAGTANKFDDLLIPLVRKTIKIFIFVFGLIYIAGALNVPLAPLLTGLGIGGAGFAFAAKDTLEHFFGSVTVLADRPFEVGDWVKIGDVEGIVEELGFRSTRVRTFYNSQVSIPNGNLVRAVVDNYGRRKYRRWSTHLTVTYETPPETLEAFCEGIREIIRHHPYTRKDYYQVWMHQFGAHSLDILLYVFFESPDWNTELRERHRLCLDILRLADRLGVQFAFPTQTLHVFKEDSEAEHVPAKPPDAESQRRAEQRGRDAFEAITTSAQWRRGKPGPYEFQLADRMPPPGAQQMEGDENSQIETKRGGDAQ